MEQNDKDKVEEIAGRLENYRISINRMPKQTWERFIELAKSEFCGDYGMTLKALYDSYVEDVKFNAIYSIVEQLIPRIEALEAKVNSEVKPKTIKTFGKTIKLEQEEK